MPRDDMIWSHEGLKVEEEREDEDSSNIERSKILPDEFE